MFFDVKLIFDYLIYDFSILRLYDFFFFDFFLSDELFEFTGVSRFLE